MATRGTYLIEGSLNYNHWDNYPSGAAHHLLKVAEKSGSFDLYSCIRGMEGLKKTGSIFNGRAEYYYEINNDYIKCFAIPFDKDVTILQSEGNIHEWINENIKIDLEPEDNPDDYFLVKLSGRYMTKTQAKNEIEKTLEWANDNLKKGWIGNASSCFSTAFKMANNAEINIDDIKKDYIDNIVPVLMKSYGHSNPTLFNSYINEK